MQSKFPVRDAIRLAVGETYDALWSGEFTRLAAALFRPGIRHIAFPDHPIDFHPDSLPLPDESDDVCADPTWVEIGIPIWPGNATPFGTATPEPVPTGVLFHFRDSEQKHPAFQDFQSMIAAEFVVLEKGIPVPMPAIVWIDTLGYSVDRGYADYLRAAHGLPRVKTADGETLIRMNHHAVEIDAGKIVRGFDPTGALRVYSGFPANEALKYDASDRRVRALLASIYVERATEPARKAFAGTGSEGFEEKLLWRLLTHGPAMSAYLLHAIQKPDWRRAVEEKAGDV
jgi:hypothetical protein